MLSSARRGLIVCWVFGASPLGFCAWGRGKGTQRLTRFGQKLCPFQTLRPHPARAPRTRAELFPAGQPRLGASRGCTVTLRSHLVTHRARRGWSLRGFTLHVFPSQRSLQRRQFHSLPRKPLPPLFPGSFSAAAVWPRVDGRERGDGRDLWCPSSVLASSHLCLHGLAHGGQLGCRFAVASIWSRR